MTGKRGGGSGKRVNITLLFGGGVASSISSFIHREGQRRESYTLGNREEQNNFNRAHKAVGAVRIGV